MLDTTDTDTTETEQPSQGTSYVQSLLDPALELGNGSSGTDTTAQPQQRAAETGTTQAQADDTTKTADKTTATDAETLDELIKGFATETGLDADDPNQRKTLKRLADKELFIRKLQADNEALKGTPGATSDAGPELMTDFEKELIAADSAPLKDQGKQTEVATGKETAQPAAATGYGDVGDTWKTPEDSLTALNEAWQKNDLNAVHNIEVARMRRNFDQVIAPQLLSFVEKMLNQRLGAFAKDDLGDVLPHVRETVAANRIAASREFAIDQLRKAGAGEIDSLFKVEDGPPIKFGTEEFPNTPLNRILAKHPEIMQVSVQHANPATAEKRSFIARYKLAYQLYKQGNGVSAATAKALVDAGREIKQNTEADRTRQALNAGKGASGVGADKPTRKSYVNDLNTMPGEISFGSLL